MSAVLENDAEYLVPSAQIADLRRRMDADVWLFIKWVCRHGQRAVERFHRPLAYMLAGDAVRLAASLNAYDSELVTQIKSELGKRSIDWNTKAGVNALRLFLRRINNRISRSAGKTTIALDVLLWLASKDPDINIGIASKSDPAAWAFCTQAGNIMKSPEYAIYYPDRLFHKAGGGFDVESYITNKWIRMNGRTNPNQETIEARGVNSQWYSKHYHIIYGDDLSSTEAGDATVDQALNFIASIYGISMPAQWGGTRHIFNGTIQGPRDDYAALASNDEYLTIRIPIWKKVVASNIANIAVDGIPIIPEWYSLDDIKRMRRETLNTPGKGAISWLQNFELTAHEEGSMQFTQELLRRSKFNWITYGRMVAGEKHQYRVIRRYLWEADGRPKISEQLTKEGTCLCWRGCAFGNHAYVEYDPLSLPRVLGVDQAISAAGDRWSVGVACQDPKGFVYALKGASGHKYMNMIAAIPYVFKRWGGSLNPPRKVGIESNAWQGLTADWLKRDGAFPFLARRIERISPGNIEKTARIINNVLANMEMGTLLLDPDDADRDSEMLRYNAAADNPQDDIIDSIAMAVTLLGQPIEEYSEGDKRRDEQKAEDEYWRSVDPVTQIDLSNDFLEASWN